MALPEEVSAKPTEEADPQSTRTTPVSTPEEELPQGWPRNPLQRRGPQSNSLDGRRCYILPDLWWLLGRSPVCQEVRGWGQKSWFESLELKDQRWQPAHRKPLTHTSIGSSLASDTAFQFSGSDGVSKEVSVTGRGPWSTPRPIGSRSYVGPWGGDYEYKSHHEGWGDGGHLHGHGNHFSGESGPQWPWTGNLGQGPKIQDITDLIWEVAR